MLLEEFVEKHPNGRHIKNYEEFAPIFKKEGCEMFLWKNFQDEKAAWEYTRRLRAEYGEVKINHRIEKFLEQFSDIDRTTEVVFFIRRIIHRSTLWCVSYVKRPSVHFWLIISLMKMIL